MPSGGGPEDLLRGAWNSADAWPLEWSHSVCPRLQPFFPDDSWIMGKPENTPPANESGALVGEPDHSHVRIGDDPGAIWRGARIGTPNRSFLQKARFSSKSISLSVPSQVRRFELASSR